MDRAEKKEFVATLHDVFEKTSVVVVAHYSGLTVAQMQNLRKQMRAAGATVKVAKNRLAKIALEGTDVASIGSLMSGPTLIAYSSDPVAAPKVAVAFAKDFDKFVILGGAMGKTALDVKGSAVARDHAFARRTACQARGPHPGSRHQARPAFDRARGEARARVPGLCRSRCECGLTRGASRPRRSGILNSTNPNLISEQSTWQILKRSSTTCRR